MRKQSENFWGERVSVMISWAGRPAQLLVPIKLVGSRQAFEWLEVDGINAFALDRWQEFNSVCIADTIVALTVYEELCCQLEMQLKVLKSHAM